LNDDDRRQLETQLMVMGLSRLEDPELIQQFATIINTYGGHDFYEGLLGECEESKRREMYDALKPYLKFEPLPLDTYIGHIVERANAIASRESPIQVGEQTYQQVQKEYADGVVVTFTCCKCTRQARFFSESPAGGAIQARNAGWVKDLVRNKEICPKCPAPFGNTMHSTNRIQ
jgi:hypothetical protein